MRNLVEERNILEHTEGAMINVGTLSYQVVHLAKFVAQARIIHPLFPIGVYVHLFILFMKRHLVSLHLDDAGYDVLVHLLGYLGGGSRHGYLHIDGMQALAKGIVV